MKLKWNVYATDDDGNSVRIPLNPTYQDGPTMNIWGEGWSPEEAQDAMRQRLESQITQLLARAQDVEQLLESLGGAA